jgi:hypothetical protein
MEFDNATNLDRKSGVRGTKKTGRSPLRCCCQELPIPLARVGWDSVS